MTVNDLPYNGTACAKTELARRVRQQQQQETTTMSDLLSGEFEGRAVKAEFGGNTRTGKTEVRVDMQIVGGPHDGKRFPYVGKLDDKSIKWTKMRMLQLGWKGVSASTFSDDVAAAQLIVPFSLRIAKYEKRNDDGTTKTIEWSSVDKIGASNAAPLRTLSAKEIEEADEWFGAADAEEAKEPSPPF
jgi:hypothetical protein